MIGRPRGHPTMTIWISLTSERFYQVCADPCRAWSRKTDKSQRPVYLGSPIRPHSAHKLKPSTHPLSHRQSKCTSLHHPPRPPPWRIQTTHICTTIVSYPQRAQTPIRARLQTPRRSPSTAAIRNAAIVVGAVAMHPIAHSDHEIFPGYILASSSARRYCFRVRRSPSLARSNVIPQSIACRRGGVL